MIWFIIQLIPQASLNSWNPLALSTPKRTAEIRPCLVFIVSLRQQWLHHSGQVENSTNLGGWHAFHQRSWIPRRSQRISISVPSSWAAGDQPRPWFFVEDPVTSHKDPVMNQSDTQWFNGSPRGLPFAQNGLAIPSYLSRFVVMMCFFVALVFYTTPVHQSLSQDFITKDHETENMSKTQIITASLKWPNVPIPGKTHCFRSPKRERKIQEIGHRKGPPGNKEMAGFCMV